MFNKLWSSNLGVDRNEIQVFFSQMKGEGMINFTSLVAHWNPATTESLISFKYWTPLVTSMSRLGPLVSGPKHQIFLASPTS